ncbi:MAG: ABC transporter substrate-binding protein [Candidatus Tectomicrobia bacterium]|uniref:ABC transporter substrate-binding protein n=1 Tax=Tectimicrobiota bacterium TaxID=2528274 RepID=A0A938B6I2_UNCTE|nr:ABC transporter substrate-binding protein [Candidatus Tectomicrobia bacterium]
MSSSSGAHTKLTRRQLIQGTLGGATGLVVWRWPWRVAHAAAQPSGQLTVGVHVTLSPTWFDPAETPGIITPFMFLYALHDALVKPMPGNTLTPSLAESWSENPNGLTYEFLLRSGLTFHNGDAVTTEDVKFSFLRYKGTSAREFKERVRDVEIVDARRVRFHLHEPWPDFMTFYGTPATGAGWIVPKKYVEKVGDDGFKQQPIGAGPYKFVSQEAGIKAVCEAYDKYWRKVPAVKRLVFTGVPEETTRVAMLKRQEADITFGLGGALAEDVRRDTTLKLEPVHPPAVWFIYFAEQWDPKSPWHDQRVRLAANYAIDKQAINDAETLGLSKLTGSTIPREFDYALPIEPYAYDPVKAKQLLKEAGYPNGFDAGDLTPNPPFYSYAEGAANFLAAVGIKAKVRTVERATFFTSWREKKLQNLILGASGAPGNTPVRLDAFVTKGGSYAYGSYPDIDELLTKQAKERDRGKREALLHEIQRLMHAKAMYLPLFEPAFLCASGARVAYSGLGKVPQFAYAGPYEDIQLKT